MRRLISRRPSPAMAVAFVALLAALTGTAVALPGTNTVNSGDIVNNTIRSKDIRNGTVRGKDVRNNSLTGRDITGIRGGDVSDGSLTGADIADNSITGADVNENTLGQVPTANAANVAGSANTANSATTAGNANTVGGVSVKRLFFKGVGPIGPTTLYSANGLTIAATCSDTGLTNVTATSSVDDAEIQNELTAFGPFPSWNGDFDFDAGDSISVVDFGNTAGYDLSGNLTFATRAGNVVTITYMSDSTTSLGSTPDNDCVFSGYALGS
jgi:hypothetical protein